MIDQDGVVALALIAESKPIAANALHRITEIGPAAAEQLERWQLLESAQRRAAMAAATTALSIPKIHVLHRIHRDWIEHHLAAYPGVTREVLAGRLQRSDERWLAQHFLTQFPAMPALIADSQPVQHWLDLASLSHQRMHNMLTRLGARLLVSALGEAALHGAKADLGGHAHIAIEKKTQIAPGTAEPTQRATLVWVRHATKTLGYTLSSTDLLPAIAVIALTDTLYSGEQLHDVAKPLQYRLPLALGLLMAEKSSGTPQQTLALHYVAAMC